MARPANTFETGSYATFRMKSDRSIRDVGNFFGAGLITCGRLNFSHRFYMGRTHSDVIQKRDFPRKSPAEVGPQEDLSFDKKPQAALLSNGVSRFLFPRGMERRVPLALFTDLRFVFLCTVFLFVTPSARQITVWIGIDGKPRC